MESEKDLETTTGVQIIYQSMSHHMSLGGATYHLWCQLWCGVPMNVGCPHFGMVKTHLKLFINVALESLQSSSVTSNITTAFGNLMWHGTLCGIKKITMTDQCGTNR